jgi:hypothetical protein
MAGRNVPAGSLRPRQRPASPARGSETNTTISLKEFPSDALAWTQTAAGEGPSETGNRRGGSVARRADRW